MVVFCLQVINVGPIPWPGAVYNSLEYEWSYSSMIYTLDILYVSMLLIFRYIELYLGYVVQGVSLRGRLRPPDTLAHKEENKMRRKRTERPTSVGAN